MSKGFKRYVLIKYNATNRISEKCVEYSIFKPSDHYHLLNYERYKNAVLCHVIAVQISLYLSRMKLVHGDFIAYQ